MVKDADKRRSWRESFALRWALMTVGVTLLEIALLLIFVPQR